MVNINVHEKVRDKLEALKEPLGCKTYSEVINILIVKQEKEESKK